MRVGHFLCGMALGAALIVPASSANAAEYGFSTYGFGSAAFGAGATPPPGTYITFVSGFYSGKTNATINFGGEVFNAGAKADFLQNAVNGLWVPERKLFGGQVGIAVTVPIGFLDLEAKISGPVTTVRRETDGLGFGDVTTRIQLGWEHGTFSHLFYTQVVAPTGRYKVGFAPNTGLNRPGIDTGWAFTWVEPTTKLQFNGSFGVTFNFENDKTDYDSGNEFHAEWAIGREVSQGLVIGVVGYSYRQFTGDTGSGALLGSYKGSVDAVGAGLSYTTLVGATPLVLNLRHYQEFGAEHRMEGNMTIFSGTVRF